MGLINDIEGMEAMIYGNDDDEDLEAELARLQGREPAPKKKTSQPKAGKIYTRTLPDGGHPCRGHMAKKI